MRQYIILYKISRLTGLTKRGTWLQPDFTHLQCDLYSWQSKTLLSLIIRNTRCHTPGVGVHSASILVFCVYCLDFLSFIFKILNWFYSVIYIMYVCSLRFLFFFTFWYVSVYRCLWIFIFVAGNVRGMIFLRAYCSSCFHQNPLKHKKRLKGTATTNSIKELNKIRK